jgi:dihydrodipicolinate synthase/N-acetylneuraminate lyase
MILGVSSGNTVGHRHRHMVRAVQNQNLTEEADSQELLDNVHSSEHYEKL